MKIVKLKDETHSRLKKHGKYEDSFDDIVTRLLDFYEGAKTKK